MNELKQLLADKQEEKKQTIPKKKIKNLITGPGFVASHLADLLLEKGEEVYVTRRWTDDQRSFNHIKDKVNWVSMDLNDLKSCQEVIMSIKPDYIFHLGAQSSVPESFIYPKTTIETNTIGTLNLLEAIKFVRDLTHEVIEQITKDANKIHFLKDFTKYDPVIHVCSSSEVYGLVKEEDIPIKETQILNPANPYAVGKVGADMLALMYYNNYKLKIIRTRMFTHFGPRRVMMSAENFYAKYIAEIEKGKEPFIPTGNMESIRTWADVRDAVRAYYLLVRKCKPGEVYNIGGNTTKTIQEILDMLLDISDLNKEDIKFETDPKLLRPYDVTLQIPDCSKFKEAVPEWEPEYDLKTSLTDLLDYWRKNV